MGFKRPVALITVSFMVDACLAWFLFIGCWLALGSTSRRVHEHQLRRQLQDALAMLAKQLRSLSLALTITAVQSISASVRRSAAFPPMPHPLAGAEALLPQHKGRLPRCLDPVEVLVQLEGSGTTVA